jgi:acyl carrier protein
MDDVMKKARTIVADVFKVNPAQITLTTNFVDDLGADSIDRIELIMRLEEAFDIEISREEALQVLTVEQALTMLLPKLALPALVTSQA